MFELEAISVRIALKIVDGKFLNYPFISHLILLQLVGQFSSLNRGS